MIPVEVGNGPDVPDVIKNYVIVGLACLWVLSLFLELCGARVILEGAEVEAVVGWQPVGHLVLKDIAGALGSIFCLLGSARGALLLFVLDGAQVPEQQGVTA